MYYKNESGTPYYEPSQKIIARDSLVEITKEQFNVLVAQINYTPPETIEMLTEVVNKSRRKAYSLRTDPLLNEARIKRLLGEEEEADSLEIKALEERLKIQEEFPYPEEI